MRRTHPAIPWIALATVSLALVLGVSVAQDPTKPPKPAYATYWIEAPLTTVYNEMFQTNLIYPDPVLPDFAGLVGEWTNKMHDNGYDLVNVIPVIGAQGAENAPGYTKGCLLIGRLRK